MARIATIEEKIGVLIIFKGNCKGKGHEGNHMYIRCKKTRVVVLFLWYSFDIPLKHTLHFLVQGINYRMKLLRSSEMMF